MEKNLVKTITRNAIVASIYFVLTIAMSGYSFNSIQIRFSEALVLLCFFNKDYTYGITIGCFISNLFSPFLPWDLIIGTMATLISCLLVASCKNLFLSIWIPVIINSLMIGCEIALIVPSSILIIIGLISLGELISLIIGYIFFMINKKNTSFMRVINANQNIGFKW